MAIGTVGGVLSRAQTAFSTPSAPAPRQSAAEEAAETPAVTQREASAGDKVAIQKLSSEESTESSAAKQSEASAPNVGQAAAELQGKGLSVNTVA